MFAFTKGKIEVLPEKTQYSPGETIKGKVILNLKKPIKAKALSVRFSGIKRTSHRSIDSKGRTRTSHRKSTIFEFAEELDKEKEYAKGETSYNFQIKIPKNILENDPSLKGIAGSLLKSAAALSGTHYSVEWYLTAQLKIPWSFNIKKFVKLNLG